MVHAMEIGVLCHTFFDARQPVGLDGITFSAYMGWV